MRGVAARFGELRGGEETVDGAVRLWRAEGHAPFFTALEAPVGAVSRVGKECAMPKYLFQGSYSQQGISGVMKEGGSAREAAARELADSVGGTLESYHFAFGSNDFYAIGDLPDHAAAIAVAATAGASGAFSHFETIVLMTPQEADAAVERVARYRPPGG